MAGNDLRTMTAETREILVNREVIAIDQDVLGRQGERLASRDGIEIWAKPLHDGSRAIGVFNRNETEKAVQLTWKEIGLATKPTALRDLWQHCDLAPAADAYSAPVPAHGVLLLRVKPQPKG
jgi:alpha-galactosidase